MADAELGLKIMLIIKRQIIDELQVENTNLRAIAEKLAIALQHIMDGINDEHHPAFRDDLLSPADHDLLDRAEDALVAWKEKA